jgi:hypothetical protein
VEYCITTVYFVFVFPPPHLTHHPSHNTNNTTMLFYHPDSLTVYIVRCNHYTGTIRRGGEFKELRGLLTLAKAKLVQERKERDKACTGRDAALRGMATTTREREKVRAEIDAINTYAREARDATRKGWDNLVTQAEEERMVISEERRGMEFKVVEATMAERERWDGRIRAAENRGEAAIAIAIAAGGLGQVQGPARGNSRGQGEGAGKGTPAEAETSRESRTDLLVRDHC